MFAKYTTCIAAGMLFLFFTTSVSIQAQSRISDEVKKKKSGLLHEKLLDKKFQSPVKAKSAADIDLSGWVEQYSDEDSWVDSYRATYEYSSDRLEITQNMSYFDGESWVEEEVVVITYNSDGYILNISFEFFGGGFSQEFYYSSSGRLDSVKYFENDAGEVYYEEKIELEHVTADSISITYIYEEEGELVVEDGGYFLNKGGNFIELYYEGNYNDRYTYYNYSFDEFIKEIYDDFFLVEMYNDEYYHDTGEWVPYSRITNTVENGMVTESLEEYYYEDWEIESMYTYTYENDKIVREDESYFYEDEWFNDYRTLYSYGTSTSTVEDEILQPESVSLSQNYPNPFNPTTRIVYEIPSAGKVLLEVYNVVGKRVATLVNSTQQAGEYTATFNASGLPSGIYYYKLVSEKAVQVRSMTLIK